MRNQVDFKNILNTRGAKVIMQGKLIAVANTCPMSGFGIRLVFTLPPRDSSLQYKRCVHL